MKAIVLGWLLLAIAASAAGEVQPLRKLSRAGQDQRIAGDAKAVLVYRQGLASAVAFARQQTNLFPAVRSEDPQLPRREEKEHLWQTWRTFLDYLLALDALEHYHQEFWRLSGERRGQSFDTGYAAFLAKYRWALEFIAAADKNPLLDTILNEPVPELGLPAGTFVRMKFRYLNLATASEFAARDAVAKTMPASASAALRGSIAEDAAVVWRMGKGPGEKLTAKNALAVLRRAGETAWFPVQAGVAEWMGDTKVYRNDRSLISARQIAELIPLLQPGDVLLTRREWFLSNIGLPGFWPHAGLYVGTAEERRRFCSDEDVSAWVRAQGVASGDLEELLRTRQPDAYAGSLKAQEQRHLPRVLEAMSEGVVFTTIEHSAAADSLAVLRPRLPKTAKALALLRAFHYAGRPYDFNFDFATDSELVCTELVFKAYEPATGSAGLQLPVVEVLGRKVTPANEIARQFDEQAAAGQAQFDCVLFLDGYERSGKAVMSDMGAFRQSWRRPKWHVLTQSTPK